MLRASILLIFAVVALGQNADPAGEPLARAYAALQAREYDAAVGFFQQAIEIAPRRAAVRKDLAYTYLKIGENDLARDQFQAAMEMDPDDTQAALEFAFLAYESKQQAEARRVFDRLRKSGGPSAAAAEEAFRNIDGPLAAGIERWQGAIAMGADNFSAHFELATLAEQRDELALAAEHYERAWRILPDRKSVLVDLGRAWKAMGRAEDATAALLAASRGGEPRAAEMARELLPGRYPFVPEFQAALRIDPTNGELRRELAYLLLRMDRQPEAEAQFRILTETAPEDMLAATQLGFLLYGRGEHDAATPLFERVLAGGDEELANRVRAVLRLPQLLRVRADSPQASSDAKVMAERSIQAGYMKDALKYLQMAQAADPGDFDIMLKLGWTFNALHMDRQALPWFNMARRSPDPRISSEAGQAWQNLEAPSRVFRTAGWLYPLFSSRWHDLFSYGQIKTEVHTGLPVEPYVSLRFIGDSRVTIGATSPEALSESSFILAGGVRTMPWHKLTGWFEAGSAMGYLKGHVLADYRGGVSTLQGTGRGLSGGSSGWFADAALDAVFMSRFNRDFLFYDQSRFGYTTGVPELRVQSYWNVNLTVDSQRQNWANFVEIGPGIRVFGSLLPKSMWIGWNVLRGTYLRNGGNVPNPSFHDIRFGVWYAFSH